MGCEDEANSKWEYGLGSRAESKRWRRGKIPEIPDVSPFRMPGVESVKGRVEIGAAGAKNGTVPRFSACISQGLSMSAEMGNRAPQPVGS
jgi:hypothetical protein